MGSMRCNKARSVDARASAAGGRRQPSPSSPPASRQAGGQAAHSWMALARCFRGMEPLMKR